MKIGGGKYLPRSPVSQIARITTQRQCSHRGATEINPLIRIGCRALEKDPSTEPAGRYWSGYRHTHIPAPGSDRRPPWSSASSRRSERNSGKEEGEGRRTATLNGKSETEVLSQEKKRRGAWMMFDGGSPWSRSTKQVRSNKISLAREPGDWREEKGNLPAEGIEEEDEKGKK